MLRPGGFSLLALLAGGWLLFSIGAAAAIGSLDLSLWQTLQIIFGHSTATSPEVPDRIAEQIIWEIRLPRIFMALVTGAGLSVTGAILQTVTRNPLADPYLFGISSGSALGAVIVMSALATATPWLASLSITAGALLGGAFSVVLMLSLAGRAAAQVEHLLLSGVAVSFMLSAFTSLILYYSSPETAATLLFWMMGSFSSSQWNELWLPAITLLVASLVFFIFRHWLGAVQAGDESAQSLGVPVSRLRLLMLLVCAALTAVLVAHVGGIGFVGLMIPHICRYLVGAQVHRVLLMALLLGASFMIWVDLLARSLLENQVIPVGIVTSAVGSLFFFVILKHRSNSV